MWHETQTVKDCVIICCTVTKFAPNWHRTLTGDAADMDLPFLIVRDGREMMFLDAGGQVHFSDDATEDAVVAALAKSESTTAFRPLAKALFRLTDRR